MSPYVIQGEWREAAVSALWDAVSDCLCEIEVRSVWWRRVALRTYVSVLTALVLV